MDVSRSLFYSTRRIASRYSLTHIRPSISRSISTQRTLLSRLLQFHKTPSRLAHTPRFVPYIYRRYESTSRTPRPLTDRAAASPAENQNESKITDSEVPSYHLTFTCRPCKTRSTHKMSKQGYHHGTVLITCPNCKNRHIISDHLKIFNDESTTIEDILRQKGELLQKAGINENGDIELWPNSDSTQKIIAKADQTHESKSS